MLLVPLPLIVGGGPKVRVNAPLLAGTLTVTWTFPAPASTSATLILLAPVNVMVPVSATNCAPGTVLTGGSFWQTTVIETVAVDPPLSVYVNVSAGGFGGIL